MNSTIISYLVVRALIHNVISILFIKYKFITICISGNWIVPDITGNGPPPCNVFTLTKLPNNRAILFGGITPNGPNNTLYIVQCMKTGVVSTICNKIKYLVTV